MHPSPFPTRSALLFATTVAATQLSGCAVIAVADTAASLAVKGAGLAADAAIGTVRITGKAVGAVANAVIPGKD
jgi:hypothetical protein